MIYEFLLALLMTIPIWLILSMLGVLREPKDPTLHNEPQIPEDSPEKQQERRRFINRMDRRI